MEQNSIACKKQIGYCPASFCPSGWETVTEFLTFIAQAKGVFEKKIPSRIRELLTETGLSDRANKALRLLTPHEKKCLGLAQALLGNPDILVIDGAKDASTAFLTRVLAAGENKTLILGFGEGKIPPLLRTLERKGVCATLSENGLLLESVEAANETVFADENLNEDEEGDVEDDAEDDENNDGNNDENNVFDDEETAEEKGEDN